MHPEEIKSSVSDLQQSSLKLFEIAYKKMAQDRNEGFVETLINEGPECPDDGSEEHPVSPVIVKLLFSICNPLIIVMFLDIIVVFLCHHFAHYYEMK